MTLSATTDDVWSRLRATRSDPPAAAAGNRKRRDTYLFALEQAEQMFRAAATVGPASRPLLVYYGLSQAGRAVAAAAANVRDNDAWEMNGHGIRLVDSRDPLPAIKVYAAGAKGSFMRLSQILDSPLWNENNAVPLTQLWDTIPENLTQPITDDERSRRTALHVFANSGRHVHPLATARVFNFPGWLAAEASVPRFRNFITAYPSMSKPAGYVHLGTRANESPAYELQPDGTAALVIHWQAPQGGEATYRQHNEYLGSLMQLQEDDDPAQGLFLPTVGANTTAQHPLMAWWAVTYTLSMLARYQPAEWAAHINVDQSRTAVPIERFLTSAIDALPRLILQTIHEVA